MIKAMQQTQNLKLNLIETSDPLSPAPLNENADTLDAALAALDETAADLTQRMIALENCRMVAGWYQGNGDNNGITIDLGERPAAVLVFYTSIGSGYNTMVVGDCICTDKASEAMRLTDNGFFVNYCMNSYQPCGYCYIALLGDLDRKDFPDRPPKT